ncbi:MAG TPA: hypothetical protein IGS31_08375 [Oscillatoriales cyanobacterium M4454_W2019_049]|nr:hypothetical protein [Oscillatoriales cyanobacterium M4454_W2019_049]
MSKEPFAQIAIAQIPKILTLLDRNPHSPTYGCFDRNFWHYKIVDFPSGMSQEFVWPLALAYATDAPDNPFYQQPILPKWVEAGILYAARSAHGDGSCDDYFPYERAAGAAAFSLLACVESYQLLQLDNPEILAFFERRADWLAHHEESGRLSNHQALIVLCLKLVGQLLHTSKWSRAKARRLSKLLSWQSPEGWFPEYEGADPGYQTLTIWCLAQLDRLSTRSDDNLKEAIVKAVEFASLFVHPDGSFGGEYASRNTYNFFPHGFELVGRWMPKALGVNDLFLKGLAKGLAPCYADDHIIGHHTWNYFLAWRDFVDDRPPPLPRPLGQIWLQDAKIAIDRAVSQPYTPENSPQTLPPKLDESNPAELAPAVTELYLAANKGGVFKLFRGDRLVASDTHFSLLVHQGGKLRTAVGHLVGDYEVSLDHEEMIVRGNLGWAKQPQMTPLKLMVLRVVMLTGGRFFPDLIRKILQKLLITGKDPAPYSFIRRLRFEEGRWHVIDELSAPTWKDVVSAQIGGDRTSIYVVMSRTFQLNQLQPWIDLTQTVRQLEDGQILRLERWL